MVTGPPTPDAIPEAPSAPDVQAASERVGRRQPSLLGNSFARLVSDIWTLAMSLIATTVTARALGVSGKGFYSTLILLAGAFMYLFNGGLPEAGAILAGRGRFTSKQTASATTTAILPLSAIGAVAFVFVANWTLEPAGDGDRLAILFGGAQVGVMIWYMAVTWLLITQERIVAVSVMAIVLATSTTFGVWGFVTLGHLGREGAVLGGVGGSLVALALGIGLLRRTHELPSPRLVPGFFGPAFRLGGQLQFSNLLVTLTARLDLLLVYRLRSSAAAGAYSVALTIGALVGAVPAAVAYASFPRLTRLDDAEAQELTAQIFRMGVATAALSGAVLAVCTPIVVPAVFGPDFKAAVGPTLVLIPAGVIWSAQWLLCRAQAARGRPKALAVSFTASFVMMVLLDLVLVPAFGALGASFGTLCASTVGLVLSALFYRGSGWRWRSFVPNAADLSTFASLAGRVVTARGTK